MECRKSANNYHHHCVNHMKEQKLTKKTMDLYYEVKIEVTLIRHVKNSVPARADVNIIISDSLVTLTTHN